MLLNEGVRVSDIEGRWVGVFGGRGAIDEDSSGDAGEEGEYCHCWRYSREGEMRL